MHYSQRMPRTETIISANQNISVSRVRLLIYETLAIASNFATAASFLIQSLWVKSLSMNNP